MYLRWSRMFEFFLRSTCGLTKTKQRWGISSLNKWLKFQSYYSVKRLIDEEKGWREVILFFVNKVADTCDKRLVHPCMGVLWMLLGHVFLGVRWQFCGHWCTCVLWKLLGTLMYGCLWRFQRCLHLARGHLYMGVCDKFCEHLYMGVYGCCRRHSNLSGWRISIITRVFVQCTNGRSGTRLPIYLYLDNNHLG